MTGSDAVTALIVEDEILARRRLRDLMQEVPWLVRLGEATNGRGAIAATLREAALCDSWWRYRLGASTAKGRGAI